MSHKIQLSDLVQRVAPSATMAVSNRAKNLIAQGRDIIDLSAGEPDFPTPKRIRDAAQRAMEDKPLGYTQVMGLPELREAIREKLIRENGLSYDINDIIVCPGGKAVIANAFLATLNPGDEVIITTPCWTSYPQMVALCGAKPVMVETPQSRGFKLSADKLSAAISQKTKWLVLNSPSNPTGAVMDATELSELGAVLRDHPHVMVLSDDIYEHLIYDGSFATLASVCPDLKDRVLTVNGVSKAYAMTGWRIGYGAGPSELIKAMAKIASQTTSNAPTISQYAAIEAISGVATERTEFLDAFKTRRDYLFSELGKIESLSVFHPQGAFYLFVNIEKALRAKGYVTDQDVEFCTDLLEHAGVAAVPGTGFHSPGYMRLSFAASMKELSEAADRIDMFLRH